MHMFTQAVKFAGRRGLILTAAVLFAVTVILPLVVSLISFSYNPYTEPGIVYLGYTAVTALTACIICIKYPRLRMAGFIAAVTAAGILLAGIVLTIVLAWGLRDFLFYLLFDLGANLLALLMGSGLGCLIRFAAADASAVNPPYRTNISHLAVWALTGKDLSAQEYAHCDSRLKSWGKILRQKLQKIRPLHALILIIGLLLLYPGSALLGLHNSALIRNNIWRILVLTACLVLFIFFFMGLKKHTLRPYIILLFFNALASSITYLYPSGGEPFFAGSIAVLFGTFGLAMGLTVVALAKQQR